jgi:hypothetical protein
LAGGEAAKSCQIGPAKRQTKQGEVRFKKLLMVLEIFRDTTWSGFYRNTSLQIEKQTIDSKTSKEYQYFFSYYNSKI